MVTSWEQRRHVKFGLKNVRKFQGVDFFTHTVRRTCSYAVMNLSVWFFYGIMELACMWLFFFDCVNAIFSCYKARAVSSVHFSFKNLFFLFVDLWSYSQCSGFSFHYVMLLMFEKTVTSVTSHSLQIGPLLFLLMSLPSTDFRTNFWHIALETVCKKSL